MFTVYHFSFSINYSARLFFYGFLLTYVIVFIGSCGVFSADDSKQNPQAQQQTNITTGAGASCESSQKCQINCKNTFITKKLLDKCLSLLASDVSKLYSAVSAMQKGSWNTIKADHLSVLIKFDDDIWPKYAGVNKRERAREMLLWVATEKEIGDLLDKNQKILKNAFSVLGAPAQEDQLVRNGMKEDLDLDQGHTFFEVSALKKNDDAFKTAHDLLKEECKEQKSCMKEIYCESNVSNVFGRLNDLGLGGEVDDGESLHKEECK